MAVQKEEFNPDTLPPLVDWKNPPTIKALKRDLLEAKQSHDAQVTKIQAWLENLNVEGAAKPKTPENSSKVQPKLIRKQAEWRYPALTEPFLSNQNLFQVNPETWEDRKAAQQNQLVLNHQFNNKIKKVQFIDDYVRTVVDEGTAVVRVGWERLTEEVMVDAPVVELEEDPSMAPLLEEIAAYQAEDPNGYARDVPEELQVALRESQEDGIPYRPVIKGFKKVPEERVVSNKPVLEVCDYRHVIIDPTCKGDLDRAEFIIFTYETSFSELEKDGRYKNLDHINVTTASALGDPDHAPENTTNFSFDDKARQKCVIYEYWGYWDLDDTGVTQPFVAAWCGNVMIRMEKSPFPDKKLPFVRVQYLPVRRKIYGEPDGHLLEDNQRIIGAVTRGMIDLLGKSANGQTATRKGALDVVNRRKFDKGQDYEFNGNFTPDQVFYQHKYPDIPASAEFMLQMQNIEAESLTGVKAFASTGLSAGGLGETATGIRGVLDAASKRELSILRRLAQGIIDIGKKIVSMNAEFLSDEEVVRITNEEFVSVRKDELQGQFDLVLTISTPEEDQAKAQELAFMLQTVGPNTDPRIAFMIMADIARLRKMPELAKRLEEYEPQPDPLQQENLMLQNQLLKAQIASELSKAENNEAGAQLNLAKAREAIAKASDLQSSADLKSLDFVEQESGVTQARELQKQGAQAQANMALEERKYELDQRREDRKLLREYKKKS